MEEQQKSIDEIFRQSLGDYREAPPAAAWEKVAGRLDSDEGSRRSYFLRWPWISLLLLILVGGAWFMAAQYGGDSNTNKLSKTAPVADNTEKSPTTAGASTRDTSSGKSESIAAVAPSSDTKGGAKKGNNAKAREQKEGVRRTKDHNTTNDAATVAKGDHIAAKQAAVHPAAGQKHRERRTQREQTGFTQKEAAATQGLDSIGDNAGGDSRMDTKPSVRKQKVAQAKTTGRHQAANTVAIHRKAPVGSKASVRKGTAQQSSSSGEITQEATAPVKDKAVQPSQSPKEASKKGPVSRRQADRNRYAANTSASKRTSGSSAHEEPAQPSESGGSIPEKAAASRRQPKQTPYAAKAPTAKSAVSLNEPAAKKHSSEQGAAAKKKALAPEEAEKSAQKQSPEIVAKNTSKKNEMPKAAKEKPAKQSAVAADKYKKPAVKTDIAEGNPVKRQDTDTAQKAGRRVPAEQEPSSFANKATAPEKPVPASKKPEDVKPVTEPAVGKWHPTVATPTQPATAAGNNKEESADAADKADEPGGSGSGAGGAASPSKQKKKKSFSLAALGGYEFGMQQPAPNNITGAFRFLWHFDPGIAIGIQPAFRYGNVSTTSLSAPASYQHSSMKIDSVIRLDSIGIVNYRRYDVSQTFDSIVVFGLSAGGTMWQIELPLILSYKIAQAWHLYGGASVNFSGQLNATSGSTQTFTTTRSDSVKGSGSALQPPRTPASFEGYFGKSSLPDINTYIPANEVLKDPATVRFGYLFGLGYERKRVVFDASMHQQVSGYQDVDKALQKVYSSPHIRLSVGYILFPQKNVRRSTAE